jgi:hypothetical protein
MSDVFFFSWWGKRPFLVGVRNLGYFAFLALLQPSGGNSERSEQEEEPTICHPNAPDHWESLGKRGLDFTMSKEERLRQAFMASQGGGRSGESSFPAGSLRIGVRSYPPR